MPFIPQFYTVGCMGRPTEGELGCAGRTLAAIARVESLQHELVEFEADGPPAVLLLSRVSGNVWFSL
jgi:hypothetical protein